jgi:LmbE family N-acetylglucosaminyl deacetylase
VTEHRDSLVERVLVVVAHPDDAEFWLGGTIGRWTAAGTEVTYLVLTDGEAGGFDPAVPRSDIPKVRRAEQEKAAAVLGVTDIRFLGLAETSLLQNVRDLHVELVRTIRRVRPQRVVTWSPEWNWRQFRSCHPDHLATGTLTLRAVYPDAGNPFALSFLREQEGLDPWAPGEIWLINSPQVNHYVDITDMFGRKVAAVRVHESQAGHHLDLEGFLRGRIADNTVAAGLPQGRVVEAFQVVLNR